MLVEDPIVLVGDDYENDALLVRIVFERAGFAAPLQFAHDGEEVIAYLRGEGAFADRALFPLPTVLLLDLNLPQKSGFEVLAWIRQQPGLKRLHVFILSASNRKEDIQRAYELGANSYLIKSGNMDELMVLAKCLLAWLRLSHFCGPDATL